ncbi:MAG TPA: hypothetical protein VFQ73_08165, partial [Flavisolibacter sp.]|nr:hypothetical protein [Flavisolibacter sp.]
MRTLRNIKWLPILMGFTILAIAAFQFYWLKKAYQREERNLEMRTNMMFRETVFALQGAKLKLDKVLSDSSATRVFIRESAPQKRKFRNNAPDQKVVNLVDIVTKKVK